MNLASHLALFILFMQAMIAMHQSTLSASKWVPNMFRPSILACWIDQCYGKYKKGSMIMKVCKDGCVVGKAKVTVKSVPIETDH